MSSVVIAGNTSGSVTLAAPDIAGTTTLTLPATTGTVTVADGSGNISTAGTVTATSFVGNGSALTGIAGGFSNMQVFTGSGTFTVPAGVTKVKVTVVGGGGSSGNSSVTNSGNCGSGGGGGGGAAIKIVSGLTPNGTVAVTVGGASGTSSFGAFCSATGGASSASVSGTNTSNGGTGGTGTGGDLNFTGGQGGLGVTISSGSAVQFNNAGGSSILSNTSLCPVGNSNRSVNGIAGSAYGGGASGSSRDWSVLGNGTATGGTGASGVVIVEY